ncbi:MAG: helix-turn-helix transcriptional regulator [Lentisphaeria bacterium]|nr:helix-turn-helix transcriptional regulator [Lentisphaeria bacterium]
MHDINETVRTNIRKFRAERGLTQEKLAFKSGLHRAYIGQIERGEKSIGLTNLQKLAVSLDVDVRDLFD